MLFFFGQCLQLLTVFHSLQQYVHIFQTHNLLDLLPIRMSNILDFFSSENFLSKFRQKALIVRSTFEQLVPLPELKSLFSLNNEILSLGGALVERNEHCDSFLSRGTIQRRRDALLCQARAR